jgi:hypothetical protein
MEIMMMMMMMMMIDMLPYIYGEEYSDSI